MLASKTTSMPAVSLTGLQPDILCSELGSYDH